MIVFKNNGEIDARSIFTFGVSSKETDSPIGFFGTGLKYAIAVLLREGCAITLYSGADKYIFSVKKEKIRVNEFDIVYANETPLAFTTELGKKWELWQAYREIYCNTMDEGGVISYSFDGQPEGQTIVILEGDKIEQVHKEKDKFIFGGDCDESNEYADILMQQNNGVFYKSILIHKSEKPLINTYNLKTHVDLTEDRTMKYPWVLGRKIADCIVRSTNKSLIKSVLCARKGSYEQTLDFNDSSYSPTDEFIESVQECFAEKRLSMNLSALTYCRMKAGEKLEECTIELSPVNQTRLSRAVLFCCALGYEIEKYPIIIAHLGTGTHGLAHNEKIYLSPSAFEQGTKYLASTVLEEFIHLETGHTDCSRELQTFLFDRIISMGEESLGECL